MKQSSRLIDYLIFALLFLLAFFLIFESYLTLPSPIQVLGRTHPLLLHLPIGFLLILGLLPLLKGQIQAENLHVFRTFLLDIASISLVLTALAGLFLAQEEGYQSTDVNWHKWSAVAVSFLTYGLLLWNRYYPKRTQVYYPALYLNLIILLVAGHIGGGLTHGKDFLLAPIKNKQVQVLTEDMPLYTAMIQPILDAKCVKCHSPAKSKGKLIMTDQNSLLAGGKHGPVFLAGNADSSELIQRLNLPIEEEYHMPPENQTQLTKAEVQLLYEWIQAGADFQQKIMAIEKASPLFVALNPLWERVKTQQAVQAPRYEFPPLKAASLSQLNTPFRTVRPTATGSPALSANFFIAQSYKPIFLKELLLAKQQVTSIDLSSMPIEDDALTVLGQFSQLEKLFLNSTLISGQNLEELVKCQNLKEIALSNTRINKDQLAVLSGLDQLETLYLWNTAVTSEDLTVLEKTLPNVHFDLGYQADPKEVLQLSPPRFLNKNTVLSQDEQIHLESKIPGTIIRYTMDGSEPDSLESPIYEQPLTVGSWTTIKARAYNPGWLSSGTAALTVFFAGQQPDTLILQTKANPQYLGIGGRGLIDKAQGKINNFRNKAWMGYRSNSIEALIDFGTKPPMLQEVVGSFGQNIGSEIFLPGRVEIWGGDTPKNLQLLKRSEIAFPDAYQPNQTQGIGLKFKPSSYRYYLFKAAPHNRLPSWHQAAQSNRKTWVFIDEVFFY